MRPQNLTSIQSLRGIAALAVCLAHLHAVEAKFGGSALLGNWALSGFAGVDLFFVISGFVMVWVTRADQGHVRTLPRFWLARSLRIYPLWWLVLTAVVVVWLIQPGWVYASHLTDPDILRSYLLLPAKELPLHAVGWTLIHEIWFYVVFGLLLTAPKWILPFLLLAWGVLVSGAAMLMPSPADPFFSLVRHPLTLEFILGALVGIAASKGQFPAPLLMLRGGAFIIILAIASSLDNPLAAFEGEWSRVFYFGIPSALMIWGVVGIEKDGYKSPQWSQSLGNWSYALYLIHVPVFVGVGRLAAPVAQTGLLDNIVLLIVALAGAILAAYCLHIGFERPIGKLAHRLLERLATNKPA